MKYPGKIPRKYSEKESVFHSTNILIDKWIYNNSYNIHLGMLQKICEMKLDIAYYNEKYPVDINEIFQNCLAEKREENRKIIDLMRKTTFS